MKTADTFSARASKCLSALEDVERRVELSRQSRMGAANGAGRTVADVPGKGRKI